MISKDVFTTIGFRNIFIDVFHVIHYADTPKVQDRVKMSETEEMIVKTIAEEDSLSLRRSLLQRMITNQTCSENLVKACLWHNPNGAIIEIPNNKDIANSFEKLSLQDQMAVISVVITKEGERLHIPMLDFNLQRSLSNDLLVTSVLNNLHIDGGFILDSGRSYHFIGTKLLTWEKYSQMLYRALLLAPIVDDAWIAHQLMNGFAALRISRKYNRYPEVISRYEG